jgi:hypothetical protein
MQASRARSSTPTSSTRESLHDLVGRAARDLRLLSLFWSDELLAEARKSLEEKKRLPLTRRGAGSIIYRGTFRRGISTLVRLPASISPA